MFSSQLIHSNPEDFSEVDLKAPRFWPTVFFTNQFCVWAYLCSFSLACSYHLGELTSKGPHKDPHQTATCSIKTKGYHFSSSF